MIVAGFGFREAAGADSLRDALGQAGDPAALTHLAVPEDKAKAPAIMSLAAGLELPLLAIGREVIVGHATPTQSLFILEKRGTGSVAEAVALAAAGGGAQLQVSRCISADRLATCAIAIGGDA